MAITLCGPQCTSEQKNGGHGCGDPQVSYSGMVLDIYEVNGSFDSDFYAIVWDEEAGRTRTIEYASTRGWTYHNGASVDATAEVQAKARLSFRDSVRSHVFQEFQQAALEVKVGDVVVSTTTRGKNKGIIGKVRRIELDPYKYSSLISHYRYAVEVPGEDRYRMLTQVRKVDVAPVDVEETRRKADEWLVRSNWRSLARLG